MRGTAIDYCKLDLTRLAQLAQAGEDRKEIELRKQIRAAYEGVCSIDSDDLEEFEPNDWDSDDLEFILAAPSDFNWLAFAQRAEYLRTRQGRPLKGRQSSADVSWQNVQNSRRRNSPRIAVRVKKAEEKRVIAEKRVGSAAERDPRRELGEESKGDGSEGLGEEPGSTEEAEGSGAGEEERGQAEEARAAKEAAVREKNEKKKRARQLSRAKANLAKPGSTSGDLPVTREEAKTRQKEEEKKKAWKEREERREEKEMREEEDSGGG